LAEESKMAIDITLRIDHRVREISFIFGSGKSSKADLSTMSGGEKSYAQLCLILSLWDKMHTPFRFGKYSMFNENNQKYLSF
jgi:hypothetical protein